MKRKMMIAAMAVCLLLGGCSESEETEPPISLCK